MYWPVASRTCFSSLVRVLNVPAWKVEIRPFGSVQVPSIDVGAGSTGSGRSRSVELQEASAAVTIRAGMAKFFMRISLEALGTPSVFLLLAPSGREFAVFRERKQGLGKGSPACPRPSRQSKTPRTKPRG